MISKDSKVSWKGAMTQNDDLNEFKGFLWYDYDNERAFKPNEMWNDVNGLFSRIEGFLLNLMKFKWAILPQMMIDVQSYFKIMIMFNYFIKYSVGLT